MTYGLPTRDSVALHLTYIQRMARHSHLYDSIGAETSKKNGNYHLNVKITVSKLNVKIALGRNNFFKM